MEEGLVNKLAILSSQDKGQNKETRTYKRFPIWIQELTESAQRTTKCIKDSPNFTDVFLGGDRFCLETDDDILNRLQDLQVLKSHILNDVDAFFEQVDTFDDFQSGSEHTQEVTNTLWTLALALTLESELLKNLHFANVARAARNLMRRQDVESEMFRASAIFIRNYADLYNDLKLADKKFFSDMLSVSSHFARNTSLIYSPVSSFVKCTDCCGFK